MTYSIEFHTQRDTWLWLESFDDKGLAIKELNNLRRRWAPDHFRLINDSTTPANSHDLRD